MSKTLRIGGVPEHFNLPWKQAIADRAFESIGIEVEFIDQPGGTGAMTAALRDNELDAALLLTEGAILDILKGGDNRLVSVYVESPLTWGIHVSASGNVKTIEDIEGKRYAISRYGSGSHLIAIVDAAERGFDTRNIPFVVVENIHGARKALANGSADVFLWEKHMTQPLVDNGEFRRVGQRAVPWPAFVVSVRSEYLADHSRDIRQVLETVAAYTDRLKHGARSAQQISDTYGIDLADAEIWLADVEWSRDNRYPSEAIQRALEALCSQGVIDSASVDVESLWHELF